MAKMLPTGAINTPWKRLPSGAWVPGFPQSSSGRDVLAVQDLMQAIFLAANQKSMVLLSAAGFAVKELTAAGRCSRNYNICSNRQDWRQTIAVAQPAYVASEATIGGRAMLQTQGSRYLLNALDLPAPATQLLYRKSVCRLDSFPPGGRCWFGAAANRYGAYTRTTVPDSLTLLNVGGTASNPVDQPLGRWGVLTFCMRNSAAAYPDGDFLQFGSSLNRATGIAVGNTNPVSLGKFATNVGGQGITGSEAFEVGWSQALTNAESEAVDDLLNAHFGAGLLIYSSTGNIRPAGGTFFGDSNIRVSDASFSYQGLRYEWFTKFVTTDGYPTWTTGLSSNGTWAQPQHNGISALGINIDSSGPVAGAAMTFASTYMNPAGAGAVVGAGSYRWIVIAIGGADIAGGTYVPGGIGVPGSTVQDFFDLCVAIKGWNPNATLAIATMTPQGGDPPNVATMSSEIRNPGGLWDAYDAAFPALPCIRWDAHADLGGAYNAAFFYPADAVHLNQLGQQTWFNGSLLTNAAPVMNTQTQY